MQLSNTFALQVSAKLSACSHCDLLYGRKCSLRFKQLFNLLVDERFECFFRQSGDRKDYFGATPLFPIDLGGTEATVPEVCFGLWMISWILITKKCSFYGEKETSLQVSWFSFTYFFPLSNLTENPGMMGWSSKTAPWPRIRSHNLLMSEACFLAQKAARHWFFACV